MNESYPEYPAEPLICFICDNGWLILAVMVVAAAAYILRERWSPEATPTLPTATPHTATSQPPTTASAPAFSSSPTASGPLLAATDTEVQVAPTPTSQSATYVIVFIPVHWSGSLTDFAAVARAHGEFFLQSSDLQSHWPVEVKYLDQEFSRVPLDSDSLLPLLLAFGLEREPADRYVGLTNSELILDGDEDVAGYTFGANYQAVLAESWSVEITAHELGHTYGLCDEYSYFDWFVQNEIVGCPNPFPADCPRDTDHICPGEPAPGGLHSIMGPAGMSGQYAYNTASFDHLQAVFAALVAPTPSGSR